MNEDCPVCLQPPLLATKLPCGHVFCFLCVKGVHERSSACALCRNDVPEGFFNSPDVLNKDSHWNHSYAWYYEGKHGWWQYDNRTSRELEEAYSAEKKLVSLLIAGNLYVIDLVLLLQFRSNDQLKYRKIKRDRRDLPCKGVSGIKKKLHHRPKSLDLNLLGKSMEEKLSLI